MSVKFKRNIIVLLTIFISITTMNSCKKKCNCSQNYDATRLYDKGDLVIYNGKCWKASSRGKGITPGPWLQDGNDIWKECIEESYFRHPTILSTFIVTLIDLIPKLPSDFSIFAMQDESEI